MLPLVLSSDSHVFEPPDLWQTRTDAAFRDRAPQIQRIDGADQIVVEADQILSGIIVPLGKASALHEDAAITLLNTPAGGGV